MRIESGGHLQFVIDEEVNIFVYRFLVDDSLRIVLVI